MGNECRWMPYLQAVRAMIEAGDFGRLFYGEAEYLHNLRMEGWRTQEEDGAPHWRWDPAAPQTTRSISPCASRAPLIAAASAS